MVIPGYTYNERLPSIRERTNKEYKVEGSEQGPTE